MWASFCFFFVSNYQSHPPQVGIYNRNSGIDSMIRDPTFFDIIIKFVGPDVLFEGFLLLVLVLLLIIIIIYITRISPILFFFFTKTPPPPRFAHIFRIMRLYSYKVPVWDISQNFCRVASWGG